MVPENSSDQTLFQVAPPVADAGGTAGTTGASASASAGKEDKTNAGEYYKGMAIFQFVKGGLMYEASVGGQKFSYKPVGAK